MKFSSTLVFYCEWKVLSVLLNFLFSWWICHLWFCCFPKVVRFCYSARHEEMTVPEQYSNRRGGMSALDHIHIIQRSQLSHTEAKHTQTPPKLPLTLLRNLNYKDRWSKCHVFVISFLTPLYLLQQIGKLLYGLTTKVYTASVQHIHP